MKILHTSDLHLKNVGDERWEALEEIVEIGKKEKIEILVICGDLFDKKLESEKLRPYIRKIFSIKDFKIILIPGNHDKDSYDKGWDFGEAIILNDPLNPFDEYENLRIVGFPFKRMDKNETYRSLREMKNIFKPDKSNILLFHGELLDNFFQREDFGEEGIERYMPVKLSYFKELNIDYVLAGHFHSKYDSWEYKEKGYFVYSGSPVSITKKECKIREVNLFEIGDHPHPYPLNTFHYEEINIKLDPFLNDDPLKFIKTKLAEVSKKAKIILNISGYVNGEKIGLTEKQLKEKIKREFKDKFVEETYTFLDIKNILEDELFKQFKKKLEKKNISVEKKKKLIEIALKAMMEAEI